MTKNKPNKALIINNFKCGCEKQSPKERGDEGWLAQLIYKEKKGKIFNNERSKQQIER